MMNYITLILKLIVGLAFLIVQINLTGKQNLAPATALDQVQNYILGGIIGAIIYNESITIFQFAMVMLAWTLVVFLMRILRTNFRWIRHLVDGKPVVLITHGRLNVANCMKNGISANDLMFWLRRLGVDSVSDVKSGILEVNGQLRVILAGEDDERQYPLIVDGQIDENTLLALGKNYAWLMEKLNTLGYEDVREIYLAEYVQGDLRVVSYPQK